MLHKTQRVRHLNISLINRGDLIGEILNKFPLIKKPIRIDKDFLCRYLWIKLERYPK